MPTIRVSMESFKVLVDEAKELGCSIKDLVDLYILAPEAEPEESEEESEGEEEEEEESEEEEED